MKTVALLGLLGLSAVACAAGPAGDAAASSASNVTSGAAVTTSTIYTPGKYVANGQILMIYSECSSQNFLGDSATGAISDGLLPTPEGDVCLGYHLAQRKPGEITVTWTQDPTAHLDNETQKGCMSLQGTYLMTQAASYIDPKPGTYARAGSTNTFVVPADCGTPANLADGDTDIAVFASTTDHPAGYLETVEGDVCGGYTYTAQEDGSVKVTWAMPADAHLGGDVETGCKSVEGVYTAN